MLQSGREKRTAIDGVAVLSLDGTVTKKLRLRDRSWLASLDESQFGGENGETMA